MKRYYEYLYREMTKRELKNLLSIERDKIANKSFEELLNAQFPLTYESRSGNAYYQIEVGLLEKTKDYLHISVIIDDGKLLRWMFPISTSFIIYKDGRIEK